jgi:hypothetical protein
MALVLLNFCLSFDLEPTHFCALTFLADLPSETVLLLWLYVISFAHMNWQGGIRYFMN